MAPHIVDLDFTQALARLETLHLLTCRKVRNLSALAACTDLRELGIWGARRYDLPRLPVLPAVTDLTFGEMESWQVTELLPQFPGLRTLSLHRQSGYVDLLGLASISLTTLQLTSCSILDLTPIAQLSGLEKLRLSGTIVEDLSPLAALPELRELELAVWPLTGQLDLSPLANRRNRSRSR